MAIAKKKPKKKRGPKLQIRAADVSLSLDGKVRVEGEQAKILKKLNRRRVLAGFRKVAPDIKASQLKVDTLGRVVISNEKVAFVARSIAASQKLRDIGKAVATTIGKRSGVVVSPPEPDVGCGGPIEPNGLDVFCLNEGHEGLDLVCMQADDNPNDHVCDHVDIFCTGSA